MLHNERTVAADRRQDGVLNNSTRAALLNSQINMPLAFAASFGLAALGIVLYAAVAAVEWLPRLWFGDIAH